MIIEKYGDREISFEEDGLELNIDIWGEWYFTGVFGMEARILFNTYLVKTLGKIQRSRAKTEFGTGSDENMPTTIHARFLCKEDLEDYKKALKKALKKKESCISFKTIKEASEKQARFEKEQREKALKK